MESKTISNDILIPEIGRLLEAGKEVELSPKGFSMLPYIRPGKDSVVLKKLSGTEIGDIVLAFAAHRYVLHRVIAEKDGTLVLMGDGNLKGTESCLKNEVLGTVILINRNGKFRKPSKARLWVALKPVRRYLLAIYRRVAL